MHVSTSCMDASALRNTLMKTVHLVVCKFAKTIARVLENIDHFYMSSCHIHKQITYRLPRILVRFVCCRREGLEIRFFSISVKGESGRGRKKCPKFRIFFARERIFKNLASPDSAFVLTVRDVYLGLTGVVNTIDVTTPRQGFDILRGRKKGPKF